MVQVVIEKRNRLKQLIIQKPLYLVAIGLLLLMIVSNTVYAATLTSVQLVVNGKTRTVETHAETVEELLQQEKLVLSKNSYVIPVKASTLQDDMTIVFAKKLSITLNDGGETKIVRTAPTSVEKLLADNNIALCAWDRVEPALDTELATDATVSVVRVIKSYSTVREPIPFKTVTKKDASLAKGKTRVTNKGENGSQAMSYEVVLENGVPVSERLISKKVIKKPVNKVVAVGSKLPNENEVVLGFARKLLGTPYVYGGGSPSGFDCSGFVSYVYRNARGVSLPRSSAGMYSIGTKVKSLRAGDLVFFSHGSGIAHVGIYVGSGMFIHSATSSGVIYSSLSDAYWGPRYVGAKRP